jgi:hypothetical protein
MYEGRVHHDDQVWMPYLRAFTEAAMVGGFAVVAGEAGKAREQRLWAHTRLAVRSRLDQRRCSSAQASLSRAMVEAERPPASLPSKAASASSKSPVDMPFR